MDHTRAHPRARVAIEVTLESHHNFYTGISDNVSEGGIFVAIEWDPPVGTEVEIELSLGGHREKFEIRGEVRWVRGHRFASEDTPAGCGIRWLELSESALAAIRSFTAQRETIFYDD